MRFTSIEPIRGMELWNDSQSLAVVKEINEFRRKQSKLIMSLRGNIYFAQQVINDNTFSCFMPRRFHLLLGLVYFVTALLPSGLELPEGKIQQEKFSIYF